MIYAVNYDLCRPGQNYDALHEAIKSCGDWWHYLGSTWLVSTTLTAEQIFERVRLHLDSNDKMLIVQVGYDRAGWLPQDAWDWIRQRQTAFA